MDECEQRVGVDCYQFRLPAIGAHLDVTSAHLWLYKTRDVIGDNFEDALVGNRKQTITVRLIVVSRQTADKERPGETVTGNYTSEKPSRRRILASVNVRRRSACWVRANVDRAVQDHVETFRSRPGSFLDLRLAVECRGGCVLDRGWHRPVLAVGTAETLRRRQRRTLDSRCARSHCCLHRLYIDFASIGWTFVRHPQGYEINYCHGSCKCKLS